MGRKVGKVLMYLPLRVFFALRKKTVQQLLSSLHDLQLNIMNWPVEPVRAILQVLWETLPSKQAVISPRNEHRHLTTNRSTITASIRKWQRYSVNKRGKLRTKRTEGNL